MLGTDTKSFTGILVYSKGNFLVFRGLQQVWRRWKWVLLQYAVLVALCREIDCSERRAETWPNRHNYFPRLFKKIMFFSNSGRFRLCSGANCCCSGTVLAKLLTNITTCWARRRSAASTQLFRQVMKLFPARARHWLSWLGNSSDFFCQRDPLAWSIQQ